LFDEAGILGVLFQGGFEDNEDRLRTIRERASDGDPRNNRPQFPINETGGVIEAMGPWISQYRRYIAFVLEQYGCVQGEQYSNFINVGPW